MKDEMCNRCLHQTLKKYPQIFNLTDISVEMIDWCWKILTTRAFGNCTPQGALIPIVDLFNHSNSYTNYYYGSADEPPSDSSDLSQELVGYDQDQSLQDNIPIVFFSCKKLYKINVGAQQVEEESEQILKRLQEQAVYIDGKTFVQRQNQTQLQIDSKSSEISEVLEEDNKIFRIVMSKFQSFPAGSPVCISYGRYSNRQLLTYYGFAMENNKYNYARVLVALREILSQRQQENLKKKYDLSMFFEFKLKERAVCTQMMKYIRALRWQLNVHHKSSMFSPTDLGLEEEVIDVYESILMQIEEQFETSLEEDLEILRKKISIRNYFAVTYRKIVKWIVNVNIRYCRILKEIIGRLRMGVRFEEAKGIVSSVQAEEDFEWNRESLKYYLAVIKLYHL